MSFTPIMPTLPASSLDFPTLSGVFEATNEEICNLVRFYEDSDFPAQGSFGRIRGKPILARHGQTVIVPGQHLGVEARLIGRLDADSLAGKFDCKICRIDAGQYPGRPAIVEFRSDLRRLRRRKCRDDDHRTTREPYAMTCHKNAALRLVARLEDECAIRTSSPALRGGDALNAEVF
jgi:hypothetical protein